MTISIRRGTMADYLGMQKSNLYCLPENYHMKFYIYHGVCWPELSWVAEDASGRIVGYVLSKLEDEGSSSGDGMHGHITSVAVLRSCRGAGIATRLMDQATREMKGLGASCCSLHVRESNKAAKHLYTQTMGFTVHNIDKKYYADGEDAYDCRLPFAAESS